MFSTQGPGSVYYSALESEPDMHPLVELGASLAPYAGAYYGANYLARRDYSTGSDYSVYDLLQKRTRNFLNAVPMSIGNTFRAAEFMSLNLSANARGLDINQSLDGSGRNVGQYVIDSKFLANNESRAALRKSIGDEAYQNIASRIENEKGNFRLVFEQEVDQTGRGRLFFQELEEVVTQLPSGGTSVEKKAIESSKELISNDVNLAQRGYNSEFVDLFEGEIRPDRRTNPATKGIFQNLDLGGENLDRIGVAADGDAAKYVIVPSLRGDVSTSEALKRRSSTAFAPLSMGIDRYNRVIKATFNQIPVLGRMLEKAGDVTGLSLKTTPDVFYKQFLKIGLQASKIGGAYMGLRTIDHYRERYGIIGNAVASAGISGGIAYAYHKAAKSATRASTARLGAISFLSQMILPGFEKGSIEGVATTAANLDIARSYVGKYTGLSAYRRTIEGALPGFTDATTGLYLGIGAAIVSHTNYGRRFLERRDANRMHIGDRAFNRIFELMNDRVGFVSRTLGGSSTEVEVPRSLNQMENETLFRALNRGGTSIDPLYHQYNPIENLNLLSKDLDDYQRRVDDIIGNTRIDELTRKQRSELNNFFDNNATFIRNAYRDAHGTNIDEGVLKSLHLDFKFAMRNAARNQIYKEYNINNDLNRSLLERIRHINAKYEATGNEGFVHNFMKRTEIFGAEMFHSFFGASLEGEVDIQLSDLERDQITKQGKITPTYDDYAKFLNAKPIVKRTGAIVAGVALLHQMITGSFFGMMEDPDELRKVYSGEKLVEIKKGRWWEAGGTPYEGGKTSYFRPHAYAMLMSKAEDRAAWGDDVEEFNPISRFMLKNFTYYLENKNYYDRPYPVTGTGFEDVPVLGGLLSSTVGKLIKPAKIMHEEEIYRDNPDNGIREMMYPVEFGSSNALGQMPPGPPVSPNTGMQALGKVQYAFRELEGLTGYAKNVTQKIATGREILGTRESQFATASDIDNPTIGFWEKDLGGFGFMSEPIRRIFIRPRAEIEKYNPIRNSMPSYIPEKLKRGDPYRLISNGFARLPGKGYEALYPELKGIDPEDYPDIHKYKILADVAPTSRKTMSLREQLFERKAMGTLTEHEIGMLDDISEYHHKKIAGNRDYEAHENVIKIPYISEPISNLYLGTQNLLRKGMAPVENLIPGGFRPTQKLMGKTRSAIETYEMERVYNTANSFWDAPIRDWFRPAFYSAAHVMGWDGKPAHVKRREELDEYYDKLQFMKYMRLAESAESNKDRRRFLEIAGRTRTGVNPKGDALSLYLTLPTAEKAFFDSFAQATGSDRERILELVPEDQKELYEVVWSRIDNDESYDLMSSSSYEIDENYMRQKMKEVDAYMRGKPMPKADWIGWHKDVDLQDIKVKYVDNIGAEVHDYDMWESEMRRVSRKPYLEGADMFMYEGGVAPSRMSMRNRILYNTKKFGEIDQSRFIYNTGSDMRSSASIVYNDNRNEEIQKRMLQSIRG